MFGFAQDPRVMIDQLTTLFLLAEVSLRQRVRDIVYVLYPLGLSSY